MSGISIKRLESLALRELSIILQSNAKNKRLGFITITEVKITKDLSFMDIYYSVLDAKDKAASLTALNESKGYLRSELARKLKARKMPELVFKFDDALAYGNKINSIIQTLDINHDPEEN